jgi:hypothetical protein
MRENYYIFLDIDGVMFDWKYRLSSGKKLGGIIKDFNPESVKALNFLCQTLGEQFNTSVVVTSTWKNHWQELLHTFAENGVDLGNAALDKTISKENPNLRGKEIIEYLGQEKNSGNYVIIDDEMFDYREHFNMSNIIKTNMQDGSLNMSMVTNYLKTHNINFDTEPPTI